MVQPLRFTSMFQPLRLMSTFVLQRPSLAGEWKHDDVVLNLFCLPVVMLCFVLFYFVIFCFVAAMLGQWCNPICSSTLGLMLLVTVVCASIGIKFMT